MATVLETNNHEILEAEIMYCEPSNGEINDNNFFYMNIGTYSEFSPEELIEFGNWLIEIGKQKL